MLSPPPFRLYYEAEFLRCFGRLSLVDQKRIERTARILATNPRHPSLHTHKFTGKKAKYPLVGGESLFIAYVSQGKGALRMIFEYGPRAGEIALHTCGPHDQAER